jgi:hypothetical protein
MSTRVDALRFVERQGIVLASGKGSVPNLAEAIAGEKIRGSWWGHRKAPAIFQAMNVVADSSDVLRCRLVERKITFVHRRLWPALVRLADELGRERLAAIRQEHTSGGAHRNISTPYPKWVEPKTQRAAKALSEVQARSKLGSLLPALNPNSPRRRVSSGALGGRVRPGRSALARDQQLARHRAGG